METAWEAALELLEKDLRRRDAAARTRRAYAVDVGQFARWALARGLLPELVGVKDVRGYIALLSGANSAPSTTARKLAALRALFASQREHGRIAQNPADLVSTPRRSSYLPRVLKEKEAARLLDAIGASGPAVKGSVVGGALNQRDHALFELAYGCGLRAEELVSLKITDIDYDGEQLRVEGKGRKTRYLPVGEGRDGRGEALRRTGSQWAHRPKRAGRACGRRGGAVPVKDWKTAGHERRAQTAAGVGHTRTNPGRGDAARSQA